MLTEVCWTQFRALKCISGYKAARKSTVSCWCAPPAVEPNYHTLISDSHLECHGNMASLPHPSTMSIAPPTTTAQKKTNQNKTKKQGQRWRLGFLAHCSIPFFFVLLPIHPPTHTHIISKFFKSSCFFFVVVVVVNLIRIFLNHYISIYSLYCAYR